MVKNVASLNTDFLASNEIYPNLISFCDEIELNRDKVAKVIAVVVSDLFKNMDSYNLKKILEKIIRGDNPEVALFKNFDVKKNTRRESKRW
ncbi:MAG: hypothetical protein C5B45_00640 [Chlamydiae bacterium]|nr:MAG: hypothetical protein C5B45_00640 [Chlamydiota bacterium]